MKINLVKIIPRHSAGQCSVLVYYQHRDDIQP